MKKFIPHLVALALFLIITMTYFLPLMNGKELRQMDANNWKGMAKEILDIREKTGEEPFWTNSMFGGMPAYQISAIYPASLIQYTDKILSLGLPTPANFVFLLMAGFYFLLLTLKIDNKAAIVGAVAYGFSSYFLLYIVAGHNAKVHALGYMAPVIASFILAYRGKHLLGSVLAAFFLALQINANHLQITYYMILLLVLYFISESISAVNEKRVRGFITANVFLFVGVIFAVLSNSTNLLATREYSHYSTRGPSELSTNKENQTSGLDRDYITDWSYGIGESLTLIIPDFKGGASEPIGRYDKEALKEVDNTMRQYVSGFGSYFGSQPFTSGPMYAGIVVVLLFIIGAFVVQGQIKWWLLIATALSLLLSWGKNFMFFTNLFLDYVPGYDKFRAVTTTLIIAAFTIPLLATVALNQMISTKDFFIRNKRKIIYAMAGVLGLVLLITVSPGTFTEFYTQHEYDQVAESVKGQQNEEQILETFFSNLSAARAHILQSDAIRSFLFALIAAILVWCYLRFQFKKEIFIYSLLALVILDLVPVDKRYLSSDEFVKNSVNAIPFQKTNADNYIHQDTTQSFRVLNLAVNTFNDASTSYYHQSIGGYHGAKLKRYKELIDYEIAPEVSLLRNVFQKPDSQNQSVIYNQSVINMLNTKYMIINPDGAPILNVGALGNSWFVSSVKIVANADSEIAALHNFDPRLTAVIDMKFKDQLAGINFSVPDSGDRITLTSYKPNYLTYSSFSNSEKLAVFSEIYYDKGWNGYIDGKQVDYMRANYILRALRVPPGEHTIEFKFEPAVIRMGERISFAGSLALIISMVFVIASEFRKKRKI